MEEARCIVCDSMTMDFEYNQDGDEVCVDCLDSICPSCERHEGEIETGSGDYVCSSCYSGMIDAAYDRVKEYGYE